MSYWFADIDPDCADSKYRWQPCLQLDVAICHSFQVWFVSETECLNYIRENILGATMEDDK